MESVPVSINEGPPNESPISPITEAGISIEPLPRADHRRINRGEHPTPPLTTRTIDEREHEQGYDSDGYIGCQLNVLTNDGPSGYWEEPLPEAEEALPDAALIGISLDPENTNVAAAAAVEVPVNLYTASDTTIDSLRVSDMKEVCTLLGLSKKGNKGDLRARLKQAREDKVEYLKADSINPAANAQREVLVNDGFPPTARWKVLDPDLETSMTDELVVDGEKFRGPCVPHEEFLRTGRGGGGQTKYVYPQCFPVEPFMHKVTMPRLNTRTGKASVTANGEFIYVQKECNRTVPNFEFLKENGITKNSLPHEWFNLFVPRYKKKNAASIFSIGDWCKYLNLKASLSNAGEGGDVYNNFSPFTVDELMRHISLYMHQGLNPSPQVEMKLKAQSEDPVSGNNMIAEAIGSNGVRRHREFKKFFAVQDPRHITPSRLTHPNWKCEPFLKHANIINREAVHVGEDVSIDEQTIGFQGKHADKKRHKEKEEGVASSVIQ